MVAAPRGEPLGRTPRLARWPAARVISLGDSVAKLVDAGNVQPAAVTDQDSAIWLKSSAEGRLKLAVRVRVPPESSRSLLALPFYPLAGIVRWGLFVSPGKGGLICAISAARKSVRDRPSRSAASVCKSSFSKPYLEPCAMKLLRSGSTTTRSDGLNNPGRSGRPTAASRVARKSRNRPSMM